MSKPLTLFTGCAFLLCLGDTVTGAGAVANELVRPQPDDATIVDAKIPLPINVIFHTNTLRRVGEHGDNWCLTWTPDDQQITSMDDGNWLNGPHAYNNHLYRVIGKAADFDRADLPGYPQFFFNEGGWFGYGLCSVNGTLWSFVSKCPKNHWSGPFLGVKLLKSSDLGKTWFRVNAAGELRQLDPLDASRYSTNSSEMFFWKEEGRLEHSGAAYPFTFCSFAQNGRDGQAAADNYIYIFSPEGASSHQLLLARAPKEELGRRAAWEFFAGWKDKSPQWTKDLARRAPVHVFPDRNAQGDVFGWYSWLPSVVWNEGLHLYIMANGGTYAGKGLSAKGADYYSSWMHTKSGSLGFWYARHPWGPWRRFFYREEWTVDSPDNRTYEPKLSPKWISPDGKRMVLIWSDAMKDKQGRSHTVNYRWNQMEITITTAGQLKRNR